MRVKARKSAVQKEQMCLCNRNNLESGEQQQKYILHFTSEFNSREKVFIAPERLIEKGKCLMGCTMPVASRCRGPPATFVSFTFMVRALSLIPLLIHSIERFPSTVYRFFFFHSYFLLSLRTQKCEPARACIYFTAQPNLPFLLQRVLQLASCCSTFNVTQVEELCLLRNTSSGPSGMTTSAHTVFNSACASVGIREGNSI